MWLASEEGIAQSDKAGYVEDGIGRQVVELDSIKVQKAPQEVVDWKT